MTDQPRRSGSDYRPMLAPVLVAFVLGLVVVPFSAIAGFWVWVASSALALFVGALRMHAAERALLAKKPAPLPEATLVRDRADDADSR